MESCTETQEQFEFVAGRVVGCIVSDGIQGPLAELRLPPVALVWIYGSRVAW